MLLSGKRIDATNGPLIRQILTYSLPLIITTIIQNLFSTVDLAVLGNMADSTAVASVGATSTTTSLMVNLFVGFSSGTKILMARFLGEKDTEKVKSTANTAILLALGAGVTISILGWIFSPLFLRLLNCPEECFDGAVLYLRIYLTAAPAILLYNYCSAILNASGNTQSPLIFMLLGGILNLMLNVILCLFLPNKVLAVALATISSQLLGALLTFRRLCSGKEALQINPRKLRWSGQAIKKILIQGLPIGLYNILFPLGSLQISAALNTFGASAIAGNSASVSLESITNAFHAGIGSTCGVFVGQNLGAKRHDRVKKSLIHCFWLSNLCILLLGNGVYLTANIWLSLLLPDDTLAWDFSLIRMRYILCFGFINATNNIMTHMIQAFGYSILTSANSVLCVLGFRVVWMTWIYPLNPTYEMLIVCFMVSWLLMLVTNTTMSTIVYIRYRKGKYRRL
jgi:putative MATE family efflux protein